ncbi:MAG: hypothetical protein OWQ51_08235 [Pyrobaculum arsenaticum]|mgnify:FL=1|uniref:Uncharacterized protein n=1 Tax=Pyrobaculum arsenaticum TaxID=121277 RepID=A0A7L4PGU5_9CREN|nr:hypothetical protein [Pyrobaculum arsenaticum]MCY0890942.1 hypothetical protein [Pyrobaculum arsenaticum]NYR16566.1 hypothetical protein [Pyrobaculum arsenaticum]
MTSVNKDAAARLALLMLEELALRRGGRAKLKYWKTYRMAVFWLGKEVAENIVKRLVDGGYIRVEGGYVVLTRRFAHSKSLSAVLRDAYTLLASGRGR